MATEIRVCACKFPYQDKLYGKGMRLHDLKVVKGVQPVWTCSNCNSTQLNKTR